jgi:hypothetical protein
MLDKNTKINNKKVENRSIIRTILALKYISFGG